MNKTTTVIIVVIIVLLGIWFLVSKKTAQAPVNVAPSEDATEKALGLPTDENTAAGTATDTAGAMQAATEEFTVTGSNFSFAPSTLTVKKGDTIKITFKNDNGTHDFRIDEFNVATAKIGTGQEETVTFVADKAGTFEYYCSVGNHRAMGMKGTLTVTE